MTEKVFLSKLLVNCSSFKSKILIQDGNVIRGKVVRCGYDESIKYEFPPFKYGFKLINASAYKFSV